MIVILSDDTVFAKMLQYELEDRYFCPVYSFSPSDGAYPDYLFRSALAVMDINLSQVEQEAILAIISENQIPLMIFGYTDDDTIHNNMRYLYENAWSAELFVRPFPMPHFLARAGSIMNRSALKADPSNAHPDIAEAPNQNENILTNIKLNRQMRHIFLGDTIIPLSDREYDVFACLYLQRGHIVSRDEIYHTVWGKKEQPNNIVDVNIRNLRRKLDHILHTKIIYAVRGVGYTIPDEKEEVLHYAQRNP